MQASPDRSWSSRAGFLLATIGVSVGLGNLWRFPYVTGVSGGAAFVLVYLLCVLLIAVPLVAAEMVLGKRGRGSAVHSMRRLVEERGAHPLWRTIGLLSVLVPGLAITYYAVVAGWSFRFVWASVTGGFEGLDGAASVAAFAEFTASPWRMLGLTWAFIAVTGLVVGRGLRRGVERAAAVMMPALFAILAFLVLYAAAFSDFGRAALFLFQPDFSRVDARVVLTALGQAFFSVGVGVGAMITFSGYMDEDVSIARSAVIVCLADTVVALLAGLAIFPFVFAAGLEPSTGPSLIFVTLPTAFGSMPGGGLVGFLFFVLLLFAAFTSALGMLEPVVSWTEERFPGGRPRLTAIVTLLAAALSSGPALSQNLLSDFHPLAPLGLLRGQNLFGVIDFLVVNLVIPVNGLLIALFAGWVMARPAVRETLGLGEPWFPSWQLCVRYLAPIAILLALYGSFGG